jgi:hypothetical protein
MKLLIKDNFFDSIDQIRQFALSCDYMKSDDMPWVGWRGERTEILDSFKNDFLNECTGKILNVCSEFFEFEDYSIASYFHITYEKTIKSLENYYSNKYHQDSNTQYAGVVYLNPTSPPKTGTSILNGKENEVINVENVYNRLVSYPSNHYHAPSNLFGDNKETGRMALVFFISDTF